MCGDYNAELLYSPLKIILIANIYFTFGKYSDCIIPWLITLITYSKEFSREGSFSERTETLTWFDSCSESQCGEFEKKILHTTEMHNLMLHNVPLYSPCSHVIWYTIMTNRRIHFSCRLDFTRKCRLANDKKNISYFTWAISNVTLLHAVPNSIGFKSWGWERGGGEGD